MSEQRLARIETLLEHLAEKMEERTAQSDERWGTVHRTLFGDGNGYKGMMVRIDRMEQSEKNRVWRERALMTTVIGLLAKAVFGMLTL